jgi:hypothetical protein
MRNFLKIPYQEEIINKTNQKVILRGARGCGKTQMAIRWATEVMKQGKNVAFIVGITPLYSNTKSMITSYLREEGIPITGGFMGNIHTEHGKIEVINLHAAYFLHRAMLSHDALVIDDACMLDTDDFSRLRIRGASSEMPMLITGVDNQRTMARFLEPRTIGNRSIYHEISYIDMTKAGLMDEETMNNYRKETSEKFFKDSFGPWTSVSNKDNKYVLDRYDY